MPGALRILPACFLLLALAPAFGGRGLEGADPGTISGLAQGVADWIVSIKVDRSKDIEVPRSRLPFNGRVSPESQSYFKRPSGPVTGLLVDRRGFILTSNYNLLGTIRSVTVRLADGKEHKAKIVARDQLDDLALVDRVGAPGVELAERSEQHRVHRGRRAGTVTGAGSPTVGPLVRLVRLQKRLQG